MEGWQDLAVCGVMHQDIRLENVVYDEEQHRVRLCTRPHSCVIY
jgi:Ser/Thr protein kinase RdoA (MazF antagonist)